jgi:hypothetical protein
MWWLSGSVHTGRHQTEDAVVPSSNPAPSPQPPEWRGAKKYDCVSVLKTNLRVGGVLAWVKNNFKKMFSVSSCLFPYVIFNSRYIPVVPAAIPRLKTPYSELFNDACYYSVFSSKFCSFVRHNTVHDVFRFRTPRRCAHFPRDVTILDKCIRKWVNSCIL